MRHSFIDDDYHLYTMKLNERAPRQITFTPEKDGRRYPCTDIEPCFTPGGDIVFTLMRHVQINDCWPNQSTNLFRCDRDSNDIRCLGLGRQSRGQHVQFGRSPDVPVPDG